MSLNDVIRDDASRRPDQASQGKLPSGHPGAKRKGQASGHSSTLVERIAPQLLSALDALEAAPAFSRPGAQEEVLRLAGLLVKRTEGLEILWEQAHRFDAAGVFHASPWEHAERLQPRLVAGSFAVGGRHPIMETLSELRVLAIANERCTHPVMSPGEARRFLEKVVAINLNFVFPRSTEESRMADASGADPPNPELPHQLFRLLLANLPSADLIQLATDELEAICAQRPIRTAALRTEIRLLAKLPGAAEAANDRLDALVEAILGPTPMSQRFRGAREYREALRKATPEELEVEVHRSAASLRSTGLACVQHTALLRHLSHFEPDLLAPALGLDPRGRTEMELHLRTVQDLVDLAIHEQTVDAVYGLARLIERGLLARKPVIEGLRRLATLDLDDQAQRMLMVGRAAHDAPSPNALLVAGAISVLGQPLGIGQGHNPTCQSARGMSIWSQHRPGYLLELLTAAARDGDVAMPFEGHWLHSRDLLEGLAPELHTELDPVSLILVPHLDKLYNEMMRRAAGRGQDAHAWVNRALYGRIVPEGFRSAFDPYTHHVGDFAGFVRLFYASHHPEYNGGHDLAYPNPIGLVITSAHADLLGFHAVLLQRVEPDPTDASGALRAYFYNPNEEGRQDWGQAIRPTVRGHGENEGESSLPLHEFVARVYAFHYQPTIVGPLEQVPGEEVERVASLARSSWGRAYTWIG